MTDQAALYLQNNANWCLSFSFAFYNRHNISNASDLWLRTMPFNTVHGVFPLFSDFDSESSSPFFMLHTLRSASPCFVCREVLPMFNFWRIAFCGALNMDRNSWDTDDENLTSWKLILIKDRIRITNFSRVFSWKFRYDTSFREYILCKL